MRLAPTVIAALCALAGTAAAANEQPMPDAAQLESMEARFAPVDVQVDVSYLPAEERAALVRLIEASRYIDALFLRQRSPGLEATLLQLLADDTPLGRARLSYFLLNRGPWSELDEDRLFVPGAGAKPPGGNFYAAGATRDEVDAWMKTLQGEQRDAALGFFTTIRRTPEGKLTPVPYSLEYQGELAEMARLLREAAALTKQPTLKSFLEKRADAFVSNDYYASDVAWMELDASIEPTIGPYEVYEDEWFNFKAAFEAFIALADRDATTDLKRFSSELQELENHLPIDPQYRRAKLGGYSPIRVVNVVFAAGDGNHGVQTAAFNLPNDERVVAEKGSKRVLLKNFQQAKFEQVLVPISKQALAPADQPAVEFESFFTHILMHELMHGLGPQTIEVNGRDTTVRQELKELNGPLEEAKADISGLWALQYLMDKGVIDKKQERSMYTTFLASTFRTLRFGLNDAHAKGMTLQVNYLLDHGAIRFGKDGLFTLDLAKTKQAVAGLTHDIMTLQAHGDYAGVKRMFDKMVVIRPEVKNVIDKLANVPVDIAPKFTTAAELTKG
jgi:hypothetical protein